MSYDIARKTVFGMPKRAIMEMEMAKKKKMTWRDDTLIDTSHCFAHMDDDAFEFLEWTCMNSGQFHDYMIMRRNGESHKMAEMLAMRKFPGVSTDSTFMVGHHNGNQFEDCPDVGDKYKAIAEAHGASTNGLVYMRGLAKFPGDPRAWVGGKGDVQRLAEERGWGVSGAVEVKRRETDSPADIPIGEDIVADLAGDLIQGGMSPQDAIERAYKVRSGQVDNYDPADHTEEIPAEALEYCPDFGD